MSYNKYGHIVFRLYVGFFCNVRILYRLLRHRYSVGEHNMSELGFIVLINENLCEFFLLFMHKQYKSAVLDPWGFLSLWIWLYFCITKNPL